MTNWEKRERKYTKTYARKFYTLLNRIWRRSAKEYLESETFTINDSDFIPLYLQLYRTIGSKEARIAFRSMPQEKDFFDAIANMFNGGNNPETITFIRELMGQYFNAHVMDRLAQVSENTRRQIREIIQRGFDEGLGARDRAKLIRQSAPEINRTRSIRIARTESVTAANKAQLLAHEASPFEYEKSWLSVKQPGRTRPSHLAMDSNFFIDLWESFNVANDKGALDEMLAPGDTNADASNVVNCRCILLFRAKRDENGRLIRKLNLETR